MRILIAAVCALPFAAADADDFPTPRMLKGMEKGQWKVETLEHSAVKPGQKLPAMTMCIDNLMKQAKEHQAAKGERQCKPRLVMDGSDEAVMEMACPQRTVITTKKRESSKAVLADMQASGDHPAHIKMRYTHLGPCRKGQAAFSRDKK